MRLNRDMIKIYPAGKTWVYKGFQDMRDTYKFNITAEWINSYTVLSDPTDTIPQELHDNKQLLNQLWDNGCKIDCLTCDMMLLFCSPQDGNMLSGALVELGHVTANDKPCYIIGTCESVEPVGNSDRAWKAQKVVYHWPEVTDMLEGFKRAIRHYQRNYKDQWVANHS